MEASEASKLSFENLPSKKIKKIKVQYPDLDRIQVVRFHLHKPEHPQISDLSGYSLRRMLDRRNKASEVKVEWVQEGSWYNRVRSSVDLPKGSTDYGVITRAWEPLLPPSPTPPPSSSSSAPPPLIEAPLSPPPSKPSLSAPSTEITLPSPIDFGPHRRDECYLSLEFKDPNFDAKQSIHVFALAAGAKNQFISEISGYTLREILDHRSSIFLNPSRSIFISFIKEDRVVRRFPINFYGGSYEDAERRLSKQPSSSAAPPPPLGLALPDLSRYAQLQIKDIRFQATDFDSVQPIQIVLSNPLSPSNDQMCEVTTLTLRQLLDHRQAIFGHSTPQPSTLSLVQWGMWSGRPERQERLAKGSTDYRAIEREWPLQSYEALLTYHRSIEASLYPKTSPFSPATNPALPNQIDLNPYLIEGSFTGPYLSVQDPSFDKKQTVYISIYLSQDRQILSEINGFTLREVLDLRASFFTPQPIACIIQLVNQEMKDINTFTIKNNENNYSSAEKALKQHRRSLTNFPSTSPPQPVYSPSSPTPPQVPPSRPSLSRGVSLLLLASLIGLAYWKRDSIRLWNRDSLSTS